MRCQAMSDQKHLTLLPEKAMYGQLFKLAVGAAVAGVTYWGANKVTKHLTGKHIHEHALDCLPEEFKNKIQAWSSNAIEGGGVHLRLLKDDGKVHGKRILRAIGLWQKPDRIPVTITEEVITSEQALQLGFDLNVTGDQELAYMVA